jgi:8-oxo-dGTP pyrophosphatase MutT (NUDIX family)
MEMASWKGAAAICINDEGKLLMVLQGKEHEEKRWSVPSGSKEEETFEECCIREVWEETGYKVEIIEKVFEKTVSASIESIELPYFLVKAVGGSRCIQDPDCLIHDIAWVSKERLLQLPLAFPEDLPLLLSQLEKREE